MLIVALIAILTVTGFTPLADAIEGPPEPLDASTTSTQEEAPDPFEEARETCTPILAQQWCNLIQDPTQEEPSIPYAALQDACSTLLAQDWCTLIQDPRETCSTHPPILITEEEGDQGFVTEEGLPRPGSGVLAGNGTEASPYLIAGWCINGSQGTPLDPAWEEIDTDDDIDYGIYIRDTDAHALLIDLTITNHDRSGILINNAENIEIASNTLAHNDVNGLTLYKAHRNQAHDNLIHDNREGMLLAGSHENEIHGNLIQDNHGGSGIRLGSSSGNEIHDNAISNNTLAGITLLYTGQNEIGGNLITDNDRDGIRLYRGDDATLHDNIVTGNQRDGLHLDRSSHNTVHNNTIRDNAREGAHIRATSDQNSLHDNAIVENDRDGIRFASWSSTYQPQGNTLTDNNIEDNTDHGLNADLHADALDATHNWWGHETGPSGGVVDACTSAPANGEGDSIRTGDADICFDPWRAQPNPTAGAS